MAATQKAIDVFLRSLVSGPEQKEMTYDLSLLRGLAGDERIVAEQALIGRAREGDLIAIETIAIAQIHAAKTILYDLTSKEGDVGTAAARALMSLGEPAEGIIAERIREAGDLQSAFAAFDLQGGDSLGAVDGLLNALEHRSLSTRINGLDGLEKLKPIPEAFREVNMTPYGNLSVRLLVAMPAVWQPAARELRAIWRHWLSGGLLEERGLSYIPGDRDLVDTYWKSSRGDEPWNTGAVEEMTGHDRGWAESYALLRAGQRASRAVDAIGRLGLRHEREAIAQLKEASTALRDPDWHATLDRTLAALS
ncbi:MAG: hypothetical protein P1U86_11835 [Verrucomicrobiales bacterium]|nr:hypothetical protein [Verrucomicrobiales bacterium]